MLKNVIVTFFNALRRKRGFRLATLFNGLQPLSNGGTFVYRNRLSKNRVFHQLVRLILVVIVHENLTSGGQAECQAGS
jgi:hypothetical protein